MALGSGYVDHATRAFENGELVRIANVHGKMLVGFGKAENAFDFVADVAKAAGLAAIAVDGEVITAKRLFHEIRDYTAVVQLHTRTIGVKNAHDSGVDRVIALKGHGQGLGEALGFVVDRTRTD